MSQMKEYYELKKQLVDLIRNGPEDQSKQLLSRVHDLIVEQDKVIREQKRQTRFKLMVELGLENLELNAQIKELEIDRNKYKQAYDACVKAI